jgi:hypothetical protein
VKAENERLKLEFETIQQNNGSEVSTASFLQLKNTVIANSKVLDVLKTEKEISKMEKDFSSVKMATMENEIEESKIVLNHMKNTQNLSKIEQNDRVTNLEYEISKMRSRQINLSPVTVPVIDAHEVRSRGDINSDDKEQLLSKINILERDYGSVSSNLEKLEVRVTRLEPLESRIIALSAQTTEMQKEINVSNEGDSKIENEPVLWTRIETLEKQIGEIKSGSKIQNSVSSEYGNRMTKIETALLELQNDLIGLRKDGTMNRSNHDKSNNKNDLKINTNQYDDKNRNKDGNNNNENYDNNVIHEHSNIESFYTNSTTSNSNMMGMNINAMSSPIRLSTLDSRHGTSFDSITGEINPRSIWEGVDGSAHGRGSKVPATGPLPPDASTHSIYLDSGGTAVREGMNLRNSGLSTAQIIESVGSGNKNLESAMKMEKIKSPSDHSKGFSSRADNSDEYSDITGGMQKGEGIGKHPHSTVSGKEQGQGHGKQGGIQSGGSFDSDLETDEVGLPCAPTSTTAPLIQKSPAATSSTAPGSVPGFRPPPLNLSLGIAALGSDRSSQNSPRRSTTTSPPQGTTSPPQGEKNLQSLTPRSRSSINNLIAKFSSPPTPNRSRGNSFIGELIHNVHSDIYPDPSRSASVSSPFQDEDEGAGSEEDDRHPHATRSKSKGKVVIPAVLITQNSTDDGYLGGKKVPALFPSTGVNDKIPIPKMKEVLDLEHDSSYFEYSHLNEGSGLKRSMSTKLLGNEEKMSGKELTEREEEEAFRNKILEANMDDAHSAFFESNPMTRRIVKNNTTVPRVFTNPSKKIVLKTSVVLNAKRPNTFALPEKTDSIDSIPDICGNDELHTPRVSPFTVIDDRRSPCRSVGSVCTVVDGNSPVSDIERIGDFEGKDLFNTKHESRSPRLSEFTNNPMNSYNTNMKPLSPTHAAYAAYSTVPPVASGRSNSPIPYTSKSNSPIPGGSGTSSITAVGMSRSNSPIPFTTSKSSSPHLIAPNAQSSAHSGIAGHNLTVGSISSRDTVPSKDTGNTIPVPSAVMNPVPSGAFTRTVPANPVPAASGVLNKTLPVGSGMSGNNSSGIAGTTVALNKTVPNAANSGTSSEAAPFASVVLNKTVPGTAGMSGSDVPATSSSAAPFASVVLNKTVPFPSNSGISSNAAPFASVVLNKTVPAGSGMSGSDVPAISGSKAIFASVVLNKTGGAVAASLDSSDTVPSAHSDELSKMVPLTANSGKSSSTVPVTGALSKTLPATSGMSNIMVPISPAGSVSKMASAYSAAAGSPGAYSRPVGGRFAPIKSEKESPPAATTVDPKTYGSNLRPTPARRDSLTSADNVPSNTIPTTLLPHQESPTQDPMVNPTSIEEKIRLFALKSEQPSPEKKLFGNRIEYKRPVSLDLKRDMPPNLNMNRNTMSCQNSPRRMLRHVDDVQHASNQNDGNKINFNEIKKNLNKVDDIRNNLLTRARSVSSFGYSEESVKPVLSFAMSDFNSSDESGGEDEELCDASLTISRGGSMGADSNIIPRNHMVSTYTTVQTAGQHLGYSKSYSSSEDVERRYQEMMNEIKPSPTASTVKTVTSTDIRSNLDGIDTKLDATLDLSAKSPTGKKDDIGTREPNYTNEALNTRESPSKDSLNTPKTPQKGAQKEALNTRESLGFIKATSELRPGSMNDISDLASIEEQSLEGDAIDLLNESSLEMSNESTFDAKKGKNEGEKSVGREKNSLLDESSLEMSNESLFDMKPEVKKEVKEEKKEMKEEKKEEMKEVKEEVKEEGKAVTDKGQAKVTNSYSDFQKVNVIVKDVIVNNNTEKEKEKEKEKVIGCSTSKDSYKDFIKNDNVGMKDANTSNKEKEITGVPTVKDTKESYKDFIKNNTPSKPTTPTPPPQILEKTPVVVSLKGSTVTTESVLIEEKAVKPSTSTSTSSAVTSSILDDKVKSAVTVTKSFDVVKPSIESELKSKTETKTDAKPEIKTEIKAVETKVENKIENKVENKIENKVVDAKVETKVENKIEAKPETKIESKVEIKSDTKVESAPAKVADSTIVNKTESKIEAKIGTKTESKPNPDTSLKTDNKVESKIENKVEKKVENKDEKRSPSPSFRPLSADLMKDASKEGRQNLSHFASDYDDTNYDMYRVVPMNLTRSNNGSRSSTPLKGTTRSASRSASPNIAALRGVAATTVTARSGSASRSASPSTAARRDRDSPSLLSYFAPTDATSKSNDPDNGAQKLSDKAKSEISPDTKTVISADTVDTKKTVKAAEKKVEKTVDQVPPKMTDKLIVDTGKVIINGVEIVSDSKVQGTPNKTMEKIVGRMIDKAATEEKDDNSVNSAEKKDDKDNLHDKINSLKTPSTPAAVPKSASEKDKYDTTVENEILASATKSEKVTVMSFTEGVDHAVNDIIPALTELTPGLDPNNMAPLSIR